MTRGADTASYEINDLVTAVTQVGSFDPNSTI